MCNIEKIYPNLFVIVILTISLGSPAFAAEDYRVENQPQVIEKVVLFEQKGILKQKDNAYLYVKVSRDFIAETLPLIEAHGKIVPHTITPARKALVRISALCLKPNRF